MSVSVHEWSDPPPMDPGAPLPSVRAEGTKLFVAYLRRTPQASGAIIKFTGVAEYHFGAPNDERLHEHPLYSSGLGFYGFYEVRGSDGLRGRTKRHWIITFHDETLEVIADSAVVLAELIEGEDSHAMLSRVG